MIGYDYLYSFIYISIKKLMRKNIWEGTMNTIETVIPS